MRFFYFLAIAIGKGFVAGASLLGIGSLAYYGLGLSNEAGIIDRSAVWPQHIRDRVRSTYEYFGATLGYKLQDFPVKFSLSHG